MIVTLKSLETENLNAKLCVKPVSGNHSLSIVVNIFTLDWISTHMQSPLSPRTFLVACTWPIAPLGDLFSCFSLRVRPSLWNCFQNFSLKIKFEAASAAAAAAVAFAAAAVAAASADCDVAIVKPVQLGGQWRNVWTESVVEWSFRG